MDAAFTDRAERAAIVVGFGVLGLAPTIAVLMTFQVLRRAGNFAVARPWREVLFTVVPRGDRYKAKTVIDTVVYRAGDQIGAWVFAPVAALGAGIAGISSVAVVLAAGSTVNAIWLGRKMQRVVRAAERDYAVVATTVDVVLDDPV